MLLDVARSALRLTTEALDEELTEEVEACLRRLHLSGVDGEREDPLVREAVRAYVRWQHDFCGKGADWEKCFEGLRDSMALAKEYRRGDGTT